MIFPVGKLSQGGLPKPQPSKVQYKYTKGIPTMFLAPTIGVILFATVLRIYLPETK